MMDVLNHIAEISQGLELPHSQMSLLPWSHQLSGWMISSTKGSLFLLGLYGAVRKKKSLLIVIVDLQKYL